MPALCICFRSDANLRMDLISFCWSRKSPETQSNLNSGYVCEDIISLYMLNTFTWVNKCTSIDFPAHNHVQTFLLPLVISSSQSAVYRKWKQNAWSRYKKFKHSREKAFILVWGQWCWTLINDVLVDSMETLTTSNDWRAIKVFQLLMWRSIYWYRGLRANECFLKIFKKDFIEVIDWK